MKKLLGIAAALLLSTSAFAGEAWKNFIGFGWRLPTSTKMHAEKQGFDSIKMPVQTGIDLTYTGVLMSNGFTVRAFIDNNFSNSNVDTPEGSELGYLIGFNQNLLMGAGWAPIRTDMFFFAFYGMLGYDLTVVTYDSSLFDSNKAKYTDTVYYASFLPAVNAYFAWTPVKVFSLYASATVGYNCPTFLFRETEKDNIKTDTKSLSRGGVKVIPTVGICWKI
ncbi:hypothetical protein [Treponema sp. C6A8]|uniref:hypothetical protein n=1 Tax=Treponema sp. C6A8 TaxID=1410609 RepID=UPI000489BA64|nr:hypothetical protein [Treponema sp. C6A8]